MTALADWLIELIRSVPVWAVYLIACAVVYSETAVLIAGLIMPSEAVLLAAGVAAAVGPANVGLLIVAVCVCAVAGDITGYWFGRVGGHRLKDSALGQKFGEHRWEQVQQRLDSSGMIVVSTGRWVGYVRTLVPRVAGMSRMRFVRFGVADVIGVVSWATTVLLAGYFAGAVLGATILLYAVIGMVAVVLAYSLVKAYRSRHRVVVETPVDTSSSAQGFAGGRGGVGLAAIPTREPRADDQLDLVEDHQRQNDQPDH